MTLLDLFCGSGGWAQGFLRQGWSVIGVDSADLGGIYPGAFIRADLSNWTVPPGLKVDLVVASPPCQQFSRWSMPWTRARNPRRPSLKLWTSAERIARSIGRPLIIENVRGAQQFVGRSKANCGPFHLWGDVPALIPPFTGNPKSRQTGENALGRARVNQHLAEHLAWVFTNGASKPD